MLLYVHSRVNSNEGHTIPLLEAMAMAMVAAREVCRALGGSLNKVQFFVDSQTTLNWMRQPARDVSQHIVRKIKKMSQLDTVHEYHPGLGGLALELDTLLGYLLADLAGKACLRIHVAIAAASSGVAALGCASPTVVAISLGSPWTRKVALALLAAIALALLVGAPLLPLLLGGRWFLF